jgi:hypothetical protein
VLLTALTGCTTYVVQQPDPQPAYVPAPAPVPVYVPEPAPAYVQPAPPPAVVVIQREDDFYQPLTPYGQWVDVDSYGRCWRPGQVEAGWRPYSNGHWELTDDGWYWASDEPWAWATYHYGRWEQAANYGWVWMPQTEWAPAWVSWRAGGGYVGWAPLPPERRGGVTVNVIVAPAAYCYVPEGRMHDPVRPTTVIVNNTTIINKTVIINKTKVVNKVVINEGPRADDVERVSGKKIQKVSVNDLRHKDEEPVAEKHTNLRAPAGDRGQQRPQQQPSPRKETPLGNLENQTARPAPVKQSPPREVEKPVIKKPIGPEPEPIQRPGTVQNHPAPIVAPPVAPPADDKNKRERVTQEKNPPVSPAPREVRPVEKPSPSPAENQNRNRPLTTPQVQPAPKSNNVRSPKLQEQLKKPAPKNNPNANQQNGRNREAGGADAADTSGQDGRKQ